MAQQENDKSEKISEDFNSPDTSIIAPVGKLDADQYSADDIDGVTESVFGAGGVGYASLQASQTDAAMASNKLVSIDETNTPVDDTGRETVSDRAQMPVSNAQEIDGLGTDTDRLLDPAGDLSAGDANTAHGNFNTSTVGSAGASTLSTDDGAFTPAGSGLSLSDALNIVSTDVADVSEAGNTSPNMSENDTTESNAQPTPSTPGISPDNGDVISETIIVEGSPGEKGQDGENGEKGVAGNNGQDGDSIETSSNDSASSISINNEVDVIVDASVINGTVTALNTTISNLTTVLTDIKDVLIEIDVAIDASGGEGLIDIVDNVGHLVQNFSENISNIVDNSFDPIGGQTISLTTNIDNIVMANITAPLEDLQATQLDAGLDLTPVADSVDDVADLAGLELLQDRLEQFESIREELQDAVEQITDLPSELSNVNLDTVSDALTGVSDTINDVVEEASQAVNESVSELIDQLDNGSNLGTIDDIPPVIDTVNSLIDDTGGDIIEDAQDLIDQASNLVDDIAQDIVTETIIGDIGGTDETDIDIELGVDILENTIADQPVNIDIDPVEDLAGDLDLDLGADTDFLGDSETDNDAGDSDLTLQVDADLAGHDVAALEADIPMNPVEDIVGDIDIDLGAAVDVFGETADPVVDGGAGGTGGETILSDIGDGLEDIVEEVINTDDNDLQLSVESVASSAEELVNEGGATIVETATSLIGEAEESLDDLIADVESATGDMSDPLGNLVSLDANNDEGNDSDVTVDTDIDLVDANLTDVAADIILDPVEDLTGDLDLDLGADTDLLGDSETDNNAGDSDVTLQVDADLAGHDVAALEADIPLDPVEDIVGDIDVDLGAGVDVFGEAADPVVDGGAGGTDDETILSDIGDGLGDIAETITDTSVNDIYSASQAGTMIVEETVTEVIPEITDAGVTLSENIEESISNVLEDSEEIGDHVHDISADLIGVNGTNNNGTDGDVAANTDIDLVDTNLTDIAADIILDPVEDLAGDLDLDLGANTDLLGDSETDNNAGDSDVTLQVDVDLAGHDVAALEADIPLDPIEDIVGDIDVDLGAGVDVFGEAADPVVDGGAGGTGDETILSDAGDLSGDIVETVMSGLVNPIDPMAEVSIDTDIQDPVVDLEIDVADALDLMSNADTSDPNSETADGNDDISWTENTIADAGGLFDDIIIGNDNDESMLPEPTGGVAEGLGVLDVEPDLGGNTGGLFG